ncbi:MAG: 30S ribosomal protein S12 methylthiotransferase RimO [Spirochaetes bacterium]|nr:30S ribosomal protein S12 methylthiotransferase RimO [Spirochaetota bacterium]
MFNSQDISFSIISLGCAKNLVDSERLNGALISAGYAMADSVEEADIIIVNTCGFITEAKEESIGVIFDALDRQSSVGKNMKPLRGGPGAGDFGRRVAVVGCLSQRYRDALAAEIPEIDFLYGLPDDAFVGEMGSRFRVSASPAQPRREPLVPGLSYSYIKISEGCSNNCSYCAIPLIRGPHVSVPPELVLEEARAAARLGAQELVIVAQDISAYRFGEVDLGGLVAMLGRVEGVEWIRLMYCHPDHCDDNVIGILKGGERVVPYIDLPFQHASASILRSMGRRGDAASYRALVERLRAAVPGVRIRSTFMVGYPGETDADFDELERFLENARLDRVGAFVYSAEEGTRSFDLGDTVPARVKRERHRRLMALQREISAARLAGMIGSEVRVLVEERIDEATWAGRTEYDAPEVDGIFYLTGMDVRINSIVRARVTGSTEHDLMGESV